jgi:hypothetical protein
VVAPSISKSLNLGFITRMTPPCDKRCDSMAKQPSGELPIGADPTRRP